MRINQLFNEQEIMHVIDNLNLKSAMAFDFIHFKLISIAKFELIYYLTKLFNLIYCVHATTPYCWRFGEITPIPKPGRPSSISKNIRPITVLPGLLRMFSKTIANRMIFDIIQNDSKFKLEYDPFNEDNNNIFINQGNSAFQPNKSTEDIFLSITEDIYQCLENDSFCELSFKDLKSAYDSVWINGYIWKLKHYYGYNGNILH